MVYEIIDIPEPENCEKCTPCLRLRMMEMGLIMGERIEFGDRRLGLYTINILSNNGDVSSVVALRQEEIDRICMKGV
jgi:Fe2+ transport system protein FeoA